MFKEFLIPGNEKGTANEVLEYARNVFPAHLANPERIARYLAIHKMEEAHDSGNNYREQYWNRVAGIIDCVKPAGTEAATTADPGSQVEAVGLLKWIEANSWECFYDGKWRKRINGVVQQKTHEELATLYKQSL